MVGVYRGHRESPGGDDVATLNEQLRAAQGELNRANKELDDWRKLVRDDQQELEKLKADPKGHRIEIAELEKTIKSANRKIDKELFPAATRASNKVSEIGERLGRATNPTGGGQPR